MNPHQELAAPTAAQPDSLPADNAPENLPHTIGSESVGLLYERADKDLLITLISAGVLAFVTSGVVDYAAATGWLAAVVAISALRYLLLLAYRNRRTQGGRARFWRNLFSAGAFGSGIVWGGSSLLLFAPESIAHQTFLAFVLVGVAAASAAALATSLTTVVVFLAATLLPISVRLLLQGAEIQMAMGGMIMVFFPFLLSAAWWIRGSVHTALTLRHENTGLSENLASAAARAEHAGERLQGEIQKRGGLERQLRQAEQEMERASRSKGDFLATISHEIRTPMNGILGALELVSEMRLGKAQRELVATARDSAESLITIINDVLDFSRIDAGRLELEEIDFDPRRLVSEVTALLGKQAEAKGLQVSCKISSRTPGSLRGDPTRLRQILNNLIGNAVKFTARGGITVRADVVRNTPASVLLRFEVEDTGIGMSPEVQAGLFQPFTQADGSMRRKFGGTGLGLSISKQLVDLMDGKIGVQSVKGRGSTFWFTVYLAKPARGVRRQRKDLSGIRLLVLTDNRELKAGLGTDFRRWGMSFEFTATGTETMAKLQSSAQIGDTWTYDAVIMDAESVAAELLPLISEIRSNSHLTGTVLVVIGKKPGELETLEGVADACLAPPLKAQALFDALSSLVEGPEFPHIFDIDARDDDEAETLMLDEPEPVMDAMPAPEKPVGVRKEFHGHLLLAEDNPVNQKVAKSMVERLGLSVELAEDGQQAVEAVMNGSHDMVLMDCQMPTMDGFQATRAIRRIEKDHHLERIPIIAVTANAMEGDREHCCLEAGMDDYLAKPFKQGILRDMLARWLPEEAAGRPATTPPERTVAMQEQALPTDTTPSRAPAEGGNPVTETDLMSEANPAAGPALDRRTLEELKEIMEDEFDDLVQTFLKDAPLLIYEIRDGIQARDTEAVWHAAHALKSSSANLGALQLPVLAKELELLAKAGQRSGSVELLKQMAEEFKRVRRGLRAL